MKLEITLVTILVFVSPGAFLLCGLLPIMPEEARDGLVMLLPDNGIGRATIVVIASFSLGAVVDSLRIITLEPIIDRVTSGWRNISLPKDYLSKVRNDNLHVFDMFIQKTHDYYRFSANASLALILSIASAFYKEMVAWGLIILVLFIALIIVAFQLRYCSFIAMQAFSREEA